MNKPLTVTEIRKRLEELEKNGMGDCPVFLTDDEEGNGYHGCWCNATAWSELKANEDEKEYYLDAFGREWKRIDSDPITVVILGQEVR